MSQLSILFGQAVRGMSAGARVFEVKQRLSMIIEHLQINYIIDGFTVYSLYQ